MPFVNLPLGLLAAAGFFAALVVHCLTFVPIDVEAAWPGVWLLHFGIFVVFVPFVFASRRAVGRLGHTDLRAMLPGWAGALLACVFGYAILNFGLMIVHTGGGSPSESHGTFVLENHGRFVRQLSEAEYHLQKAYVVRGFSGHWLVFYLVPALYFLFGPSRGGTGTRPFIRADRIGRR